MDVLEFLLASLPVFVMSVLIRHNVQKWVAEENERGFHIVGGILQIGTWWIHSVGFIYTLIRRKVPYLPTPKNDTDSLPLSLNMPNILIAVISLAAIIYGMWRDYNPYTLFMVGLAYLQIAFMIFILSISGYVDETDLIKTTGRKLRKKTSAIIATHSILRRYSLPLSFVALVAFVFAFRQHQLAPGSSMRPLPGHEAFYYGIQQGNQSSGEAENALISIAAKRKDIAMVAFDVPWRDKDNFLDTAYLQKIYTLNAIPLLCWQPVQSDAANAATNGKAACKSVLNGLNDEVIQSFARQVAAMDRPLFLRIPDADAAKMPMLTAAGANATEYIAAWRYIHEKFDSAGCDKVVWIWDAPAHGDAETFFPGAGFVDWLGLDANTLPAATDGSADFASRYDSFHLLPLFKSGLPVIITGLEKPLLAGNGWWTANWKAIEEGFTEIRSVVVSIGKEDQDGYNKHSSSVAAAFKNAPAPHMPLKRASITWAQNRLAGGVAPLAPGIKSIVYDKGFFWFRNRHTLNTKTVEADIAEMKKIGINTIERTVPGFYDNTVQRALAANKINFIPRFYLLSAPEEIDNRSQLEKQREKVLLYVKKNIGNKSIIAWHLGGDMLYTISCQAYKPDYFYFRDRYLAWLSDLCNNIRMLDSTRPILTDLHWDASGQKRYISYKKRVPQIDGYMLEADEKWKDGLRENLSGDMAWGKVDVKLWPFLPAIKYSGTIPAWQDIENMEDVKLDGLLDLEARKRTTYTTVMSTWNNKPAPISPLPDIRILKPAKLTYSDAVLTYRILYKNRGRWLVYDDKTPGMRLEWYLVRADQYGNGLLIRKKGEGSSISLSIPENPELYRLYVEAVAGDQVQSTFDNLNIPVN